MIITLLFGKLIIQHIKPRRYRCVGLLQTSLFGGIDTLSLLLLFD